MDRAEEKVSRRSFLSGTALTLGVALLSGCGGDQSTMQEVSPSVTVPKAHSLSDVLGAKGPNLERRLVVIISDIHLGDQRSIDGGYGWFIKNEGLLVAFLNTLASSQGVKELVLAGDLFDEWVAPVEADALDNFGSNQAGESRYVDSIALAHAPVIAAIQGVINSGIWVTYVPGNHDMAVVESDIDRIFPGIHQQRDAAGLGRYSPQGLPEVLIEHGHRYDFFNAPDMISNRVPVSPVTYTSNPLAVTPPGFFVTKIVSSAGGQSGSPYTILPEMNLSGTPLTHGVPVLYWAAWEGILTIYHVSDRDAQNIKTGIDGYSGIYATNNLVPQRNGLNLMQPMLYAHIEDNWYQRQMQNLTNVPISVLSGLIVGDSALWCGVQSWTQYFNTGTRYRVVVFGHTHKAALGSCQNNRGDKCLYANSGTWIDNGNPDCTLAVIDPCSQLDGSVLESVAVYQYTEEHMLRKLHEDSIILPA